MKRAPRGGPGDLGARLARAEQLVDEAKGAAREPLSVQTVVLRHQRDRSGLVAKRGPRGGHGEPGSCPAHAQQPLDEP
jgi:hypothetical protein